MRKLLLLMMLFAQVSAAYAQVFSVVEESSTDVEYISATEMVCKERRVITVLDKKGLQAADFQVSLNKGCSSLSRFSGIVTDAQGKVVRKIKKGDLAYSEYSEMLADDACHYHYGCASPGYPFTVTYEWEEKHKDGILGLPLFIPQNEYHQVVHSAHYHLEASPGLGFSYKVFNADADVKESVGEKGRKVLDIYVDSLPALCKEPLSPSMYELLPFAYVVPAVFVFDGYEGSYASWQEYAAWLYSLMEGRGALPQDFVSELKQKASLCGSDREKVQLVYDFLASSTRYVSVQLGVGGMQPALASDVHRMGYGDCKALTNYTRAILAELGIESNYVVINTARENITRDFVNGAQFNHAILQVPLSDDTLWLECTNPTLPLGYLHDGIAGHEALVVTDAGGALCRLPAYADSLNLRLGTIKLVLADDGGVAASVRHECRAAQYESLKFLSRLSEAEKRDFLRSSLDMPNADIVDIGIDEVKGDKPVFAVKCSVMSNRYGSKSGNRFFLPLNPFKSTVSLPDEEERHTDIVIKSGGVYLDSVEFVFPETFEVESLAEPVDFSTPFGSISLNVVQDGNSVSVVQRLSLSKGRYPKEMYGALRLFVKVLSGIGNSKIVLRKVK
jgi:hypothetical protein